MFFVVFTYMYGTMTVKKTQTVTMKVEHDKVNMYPVTVRHH